MSETATREWIFELNIDGAYHRGLFSAKAKRMTDGPGAMMAVNLGESEAMQYAKRSTSGTAVVACVNSPLSQTLSGDESAIDEIKSMLDKEGLFARKLKVDTAYHSHHMQRVAKNYQETISGMDSCQVRDDVIFYSSVTGALKTTGFSADYWTSNLVSQVKFSQALKLLRNDQTKHDTNMNARCLSKSGLTRLSRALVARRSRPGAQQLRSLNSSICLSSYATPTPCSRPWRLLASCLSSVWKST